MPKLSFWQKWAKRSLQSVFRTVRDHLYQSTLNELERGIIRSYDMAIIKGDVLGRFAIVMIAEIIAVELPDDQSYKAAQDRLVQDSNA